MSKLENQAVRLLQDNEIDAVNGGFINDNGCTTLSGIIIHPLPPQGGYQDPFASILPGWVQNPPR
jgi:hypothetical protein